MKDLSGHIALVTGASRGIGLAIAEALCGAGLHVVRLARSLEDASSPQRTDLRCDVTREDDVDRAVDTVIKKIGAPDIVVNNAGSFLLKPLIETTWIEFANQISVNLTASFLVLRRLLPALLLKGDAHIVTIGSVADHVAYPGNAAYGASKFGLRGLHEVLSAELHDTNIRTTLISPGPTDTRLWNGLVSENVEDLPDRAEMLQPTDVAEAVLFALTRSPRANIDVLRITPTS